MPILNDTRRLFLRNETAEFKVHFFADAAQTIPLTPLDSAVYPAYTIYDIDNEAIQSGVGQPEATPGRYKAEFLVPPDAPLSNDVSRWRIEWTMVATDNRQVEFTEEFDVKDTVITASETREQKFVTLSRATYRAMLRLGDVVPEVSLNVYIAGSNDVKIVDNATLGAGGILQATDGDSIVYYFDIDGSLMADNCFFEIIWAVRNQLTEPQQFIYQQLTSVAPSVMGMITSVRMLIDKLQKRLGTVQAYEDSDILEYLSRGHELVNAVYPTTTYQFGALPQAFNVFHALFSAWYALQAQYILETDLGFDVSGQTVTLSYDHASNLAEVAGRWEDFINTNLPPAKMAILRRTTPVGNVSGRMMSYRNYFNYTFLVWSQQGRNNSLVSHLNHLGLLF